MKAYIVDIKLRDLKSPDYREAMLRGYGAFSRVPDEGGLARPIITEEKHYQVERYKVSGHEVVCVAVQRDQKDLLDELIAPKLDELQRMMNLGIQKGISSEWHHIRALPWWKRLFKKF